MGGFTMLAEEVMEKLTEYEVFFIIDEYLGTRVTSDLEILGLYGVAYKINGNEIQRIDWFKSNTQNYEISEPKMEKKFIFHDKIISIMEKDQKIKQFIKKINQIWRIKS